MDELKLTTWKKRFEQEVNNMQTEYNAFLLNKKLHEIYTISVDESHEWKLQVEDNIPNEIKGRLQQLFLAAKP